MYRTPYSILNFNCPVYLKEEIDEICKFRGVSRTALINTFFEATVKEWRPQIERLRQRQNQHSRKENSPENQGIRHSLPDFFSSNDPEGMDNDW